MTEDEMVGWDHRLNRHEFEQAPGDGKGQGGLAYCSPWGRKELDMTEQLNTPKCYSKQSIALLLLFILFFNIGRFYSFFFHFFRYVSRSRISGYGNSVFKFLRNDHTVLNLLHMQ